MGQDVMVGTKVIVCRETVHFWFVQSTVDRHYQEIGFTVDVDRCIREMESSQLRRLILIAKQEDSCDLIGFDCE